VGASGSGKSSLANLLLRFYEPSSGVVLIDGQDIRSFTLASLRQNIAMVNQDTMLFDDSISANVSFGLGNEAQVLPKDELQQRVLTALESAHLLDVVRALPQGVQTPIGDNGNRLSGGQRQRLAIARALIKDAPILILDEATSALDNESERAVQAALQSLMKGRTTLVVAHRLSTIINADRIIVLDKGQLVEQGTHDELMVRGGFYSRLYSLSSLSQ
jgi:ATP-binding cassette, subfamily B, bacterial MsbA